MKKKKRQYSQVYILLNGSRKTALFMFKNKLESTPKGANQMFLGKHTNTQKLTQETNEILLKENKRLRRENQKLTETLLNLEDYKNEYVTLIEEMNQLRAEYSQKLTEVTQLELEYRKALGNLVKTETRKYKK